MRQLLLVAVLAAVASSALTALVCSVLREAPPAASPASGLTEAGLRAALADLVKETAALRRAAEARRGAPTQGDAAAESSSGAAETGAAPRAVRSSRAESVPTVPDAASSSNESVVRRGLPPGLSPADASSVAERFRQLVPRREDADEEQAARLAERRRWLFRGEREVFEWFGQPDDINAEGEAETWYYRVPTGTTAEDGTPETNVYWIRLNKGRVVQFDD